MTQILDEIERKHNQTKYAKLSFAISLVTAGLCAYLMLSIPSTIHVAEGYHAPPLALIVALQFSCLVGAIVAALSFVKKEPATWYKWVGGVLNIILFLLVLGAVVFAKLV